MNKVRGNMANIDRAKQFAPFAALKGHEMELAKKREIKEDRIILAEDEMEKINSILISLRRDDNVEVVYYNKNKYDTILGIVEKIYDYEASLKINNRKIHFNDIYRIEKKEI